MSEEAGPAGPWLAKWGLIPDGDEFVSPLGSRLAPVRHRGAPAMLKIAGHPEEREGGAVMEWWAGDGAARVLAREDAALLMERATGDRSLARMAEDGRDDEASRILCAVAADLHRPRAAPGPGSLHPLPAWFGELEATAAAHGGVLAKSAAAAQALLGEPQGSAVLHGDLHHDNVLDFGPRGWLAIDPKGLIGEPGFDFANIFCNPWPAADDRQRFERRLLVVAATANLDPRRLRQWILAYTGLSAAWTINSAMPPDGPWRAFRIAEMAAAGL